MFASLKLLLILNLFIHFCICRWPLRYPISEVEVHCVYMCMYDGICYSIVGERWMTLQKTAGQHNQASLKSFS